MTNKRPDVLHGATPKIKTGCGNLYVTLNKTDEGRPFEIFLNFGMAGGCAAASAAAIGLMASLALRNGASVADVIHGLKGIGCHVPIDSTKSCYDGLAKVLAELEPLPPRKD